MARAPRTFRLHALTLAILTSTIAVRSQDRIAVLSGTTPSDLSLLVFDESNPSAAPAAVLTNLEILGIEITNRTAQMSFVPGRARIESRQQLPSIALPDGGRLFHFRRASASTGTSYGYLWIRPSGVPAVVHERPGVGTGGRDNPYEDRIGVAPTGGHACISMLAGEVFLARLDGSNYASTGTPSRRLALPTGVTLEPKAVALNTTHAFFVTDDDRIRRCALADGNQPIDVTPPGPSNARLKDELAPSGDGKTVAFLFGPKDLYSIYLLRNTGTALRLPPPAAKYEEPGYLPDVIGGPRMLLNGDGSRLMYTDATLRDEIYVLDTLGNTGTTHITSDNNFQPYVGVGILPSFSALTLVLAIGDPNAHDWYTATTSSRVVSNVTGTGPTTRPFGSGAIDPETGFLAADGAVITAEKLPGGGSRLRRLDPVSRTSTFPVAALRAPIRMGSALDKSPTVLAPGRFGDAYLSGNPSTPVLTGPPGVLLSTQIRAASGWFSVFDARDASRPNAFALPILHVHGVGLELLPPEPALRQIVLTRSGGAVLNGRTMRYLAPGISATLQGTAPIRILVSGATN